VTKAPRKGPFIHGPAKGAGYGGPARDIPHRPKAPEFTPGNAEAVGRRSAAEVLEENEFRTRHLRTRLFQLSFEAESEAVQAKAAESLDAIMNGRPRQMVELTGKDGGPMEVETGAIRERIAGRIAGIAAREGPTGNT